MHLNYEYSRLEERMSAIL